MPKTTLTSKSSTGRTLTIDPHTPSGNLYIEARDALDETFLNLNLDGLALRDALLEAFPLRDEPAVAAKDEPLAEWEKELLGIAKPKPDVVPGMVFKDKTSGALRVTLPREDYHNVETGRTYSGSLTEDPSQDLVFDPRDAKALPNPLGIRVGDTVRRTTVTDSVTGITEFVVHHIDTSGTGFIKAKYGQSYNPKGFEVVSRTVPDRLPAGTITRATYSPGYTCLRTADGFIRLQDGSTRGACDADALEKNVRNGSHEVIYLP